MLHDPIEQRPLKSDVVPRLLAFNPLVAQDLLALRQELAIQRRVHDHVFRVGVHVTFITHAHSTSCAPLFRGPRETIITILPMQYRNHADSVISKPTFYWA